MSAPAGAAQSSHKAPRPATDITWQQRALCREMPADLFFAGEGQRGHKDDRPAKKACGACEVRKECLDFALTNREEWGVWGGVGEKERKRMLAGVA